MDVLDAYQVQVYRELVCVEVLGGLRDQAAVDVDLVREALRQVRNMLEGAERLKWATMHLPLILKGVEGLRFTFHVTN